MTALDFVDALPRTDLVATSNSYLSDSDVCDCDCRGCDKCDTGDSDCNTSKD